MSPLISIIIPVYNAEKYLSKCIESLINQSIENIEFIFINDGSIDNSKLIIESYMKKDKRILLINKQNSGASDCRNIGIEKAKGQYVGFVDSDDWVAPNMFETLYKNIKYNKSDMCIGGYNLLINNSITKIKLNLNKKIYRDKEIINEIAIPMVESNSINESNKNQGFIWNNIYNLNIIRDNNIKFHTNLKIGEDILFNLNFLKYCTKVSISDSFGYFYRYNQNSQTVSYNKNLKNIMDELFKEISSFIENNDLLKYTDKRLDILLVNMSNYMIVNESNLKSIMDIKYRINNISKICSNPKLQESIKKLYIEELTLKKRLTLFLIKNKLSIILLIYYSTRRYILKQKNKEL